jgi:hypothetical protein
MSAALAPLVAGCTPETNRERRPEEIPRNRLERVDAGLETYKGYRFLDSFAYAFDIDGDEKLYLCFHESYADPIEIMSALPGPDQHKRGMLVVAAAVDVDEEKAAPADRDLIRLIALLKTDADEDYRLLFNTPAPGESREDEPPGSYDLKRGAAWKSNVPDMPLPYFSWGSLFEIWNWGSCHYWVLPRDTVVKDPCLRIRGEG